MSYPCWDHSPQNPAVVPGVPHPYISPFAHSVFGDPHSTCPGYISPGISEDDVQRIALKTVDVLLSRNTSLRMERPHPTKEKNPMKTITASLKSIPTPVRILIGLTLFFFIGKTLSNR